MSMIACSSSSTAENDAAIPDSGTPAKDAASDAGDLGLPQGSTCSFNEDCLANLRCEEKTITCQPGVRGAGKNGIDACTSGDECASALCVEGPTDGAFVCSGHCFDDQDCGGKLPRCLTVPQIGSFCARGNASDAGP